MAITENRGGPNGGPQYNPMNVNPFGGNGQSGNIDYTGFAYGMNQAINQQRQSAPISTQSPRPAPVNPRTGGEVVGITEPSIYPNEDVTTYNPNMITPSTPGVLPEPGQMLPGQTDTDLIRSYIPALEFWASMPGTPQTTKDYVRYLRTVI